MRSARSRGVADLLIGAHGGCGIIAPQRSSSAHLHRPWRADKLLTLRNLVVTHAFVRARGTAEEPPRNHRTKAVRATNINGTHRFVAASPAGGSPVVLDIQRSGANLTRRRSGRRDGREHYHRPGNANRRRKPCLDFTAIQSNYRFRLLIGSMTLQPEVNCAQYWPISLRRDLALHTGGHACGTQDSSCAQQRGSLLKCHQ
jgi:hypothetical protein